MVPIVYEDEKGLFLGELWNLGVSQTVYYLFICAILAQLFFN